MKKLVILFLGVFSILLIILISIEFIKSLPTKTFIKFFNGSQKIIELLEIDDGSSNTVNIILRPKEEQRSYQNNISSEKIKGETKKSKIFGFYPKAGTKEFNIKYIYNDKEYEQAFSINDVSCEYIAVFDEQSGFTLSECEKLDSTKW